MGIVSRGARSKNLLVAKDLFCGATPSLNCSEDLAKGHSCSVLGVEELAQILLYDGRIRRK
jgi:hypothetical protein